MSPPVGPTGLPQTCDGDAHRVFRAGAAFAGVDTTLRFRDGGHAAFQQLAVAGSFDWRASDRWTLQIAVGSAVGGHLVHRGIDHPIRPGPLASLAASYRWVSDPVFVVTTMSIAQSFVRAGDAAFRAGDARLGLAIGKTFGPFAPFATARAFAGPVSFAGDSGTDRYKYSVGAGALLFTRGLDLAIEIGFLGERRLTAGGGLSF